MANPSTKLLVLFCKIVNVNPLSVLCNSNPKVGTVKRKFENIEKKVQWPIFILAVQPPHLRN